MKIRAAVLEEFGKPLVVQDVELAGPKAARCSCASRPAASATPTSTPPAAPIRRATRRACSGHEGAGVVEAIGEGVTSVRRAIA